MSTKIDAYVRDLSTLLVEKAYAARKERDSAASDEDRAEAIGRVMALHDVVSLMQQQAIAFGIPLESIGLAGIDPDRDLL